MRDDDFHHWSPELRRAVMKVRPEYFTWARPERDRYSAAIPREDRNAVDAALLRSLFKRDFDSLESAKKAVDELPLECLNRWNETLLPLTGIGEDCFFLNEHFADGRSLLDFPTLRDYDADEHAFQEEHRLKHIPDYEPKPYRGDLHYNWARLFVDGAFTYGTLSMASRYINALASEAASNRLDALLPHEYVPGPEHQKQDERGYLRWDMRIQADGKEGVIDELRHRLWTYESERLDALREEWDCKGFRGVYLQEASEHGEHNLHFVFTDKEILSDIRFHSFLRDCLAAKRDSGELQRAVEIECATAIRFIDEQCAEVLRTYDPKVTPLRRRKTVMMAPGVLDALE